MVNELRVSCPREARDWDPGTIQRHPVAGTQNPQVRLSRLDRGAAVRTSGEQPQPAPGPRHPGAGLKHRATAGFPPPSGGTAPTSTGTRVPPNLVPVGSHPAPSPETDAAEPGAPTVGAG